jgi:hypothetical protein
MIDQYDELPPKLERHIRACAKGHDIKGRHPAALDPRR